MPRSPRAPACGSARDADADEGTLGLDRVANDARVLKVAVEREVVDPGFDSSVSGAGEEHGQVSVRRTHMLIAPSKLRSRAMMVLLAQMVPGAQKRTMAP